MYVITADYFNSFTAIFGPKECELNGAAYPLGHFAVKALEMDVGLLRQLERAVARFKPELGVFLAARTASSAAVAQQKANEVWRILSQLPAYEHLAPCFGGVTGLFHAMREHPDRTDDAVTSGMEFNRALAHWLDRLERLSDSLDNFFRNTFLLVEDFFEDLPSRSPEAYAIAYQKYRSMICTACDNADDEIDEDLNSVQLDFPVRLGF